MNGKYLLEKMELIDPEFVAAADKLPKKKPLMLPQWIALAACLAIAVMSGTMMILQPDNGAEVIVSSGDTASMFGNGGIELALIFLSLLAASGILAYILKKRKE